MFSAKVWVGYLQLVQGLEERSMHLVQSCDGRSSLSLCPHTFHLIELHTCGSVGAKGDVGSSVDARHGQVEHSTSQSCSGDTETTQIST